MKLRDQKIIPVPTTDFAESDVERDGALMDLDLGEEEGLEVMVGAGRFLAEMDHRALSR